MPVRSATSWAEVDLAAIRHNVRLLRRIAGTGEGSTDVAAVVKADAYGHGVAAVARAALQAGAASLCVFTIAEAIELRDAGINAPILCLGPVLPLDPPAFVQHDVAAVVDSPDTAVRLQKAAQASGRTIQVQLNVDSGMQRYGVRHEAARTLADLIRAMPELELAGIFTHFPDATDTAASQAALLQLLHTADQIDVPMRHAAASAGILHLPNAALDMVRAGLALYGIDPAPQLAHADAIHLQPALSWRAMVLAVRSVAAGESVSYAGRWTAARPVRIAVVGVGYADGLARACSDGGAFIVRGRRCHIRGAVCMDTTMIEVTDIPHASVGDVATIIGTDGDETISAWEIARRLDTIPYEMLTRIAARVPRRLVDSAIRS